MRKGVLDFAKEPDNNAKRYSVRLSTALYERARLFAFENRTSFNRLLTTCLEEYLDQKTAVSSQVSSTYKVEKSETGERIP